MVWFSNHLFSAYLMNVNPERRRSHLIRYLRIFYHRYFLSLRKHRMKCFDRPCFTIYRIAGIVPKANRKITERGKISTLTHKYMTGPFPVGTCTSMKSGGVKLVGPNPTNHLINKNRFHNKGIMD